MVRAMEAETETDPEFCYGVGRQLVDHDEGHQGSFCTAIFEGMAQYHGTCNIVSARSGTGEYIGRTWKVGIVHEQLEYGQLTMEIVMRGNCAEAVWVEGLTVAKTAAPMGAITAGRGGGGGGGRGRVTQG